MVCIVTANIKLILPMMCDESMKHTCRLRKRTPTTVTNTEARRFYYLAGFCRNLQAINDRQATMTLRVHRGLHDPLWELLLVMN